jgi:hypothetical protein
VKVKRPSRYFDPDNAAWPDVVELRLQMPTELQLDYGTELAQQRIAERVKAREHHAWQESKRTGIAFAGARRVLRQAHTKRARSYAARRTDRAGKWALSVEVRLHRRCSRSKEPPHTENSPSAGSAKLWQLAHDLRPARSFPSATVFHFVAWRQPRSDLFSWIFFFRASSSIAGKQTAPDQTLTPALNRDRFPVPSAGHA